MPLDTITARLNKQVGFDAKIMGDRKLTRAIEHRRVACGLADVEEYCRVLQTSPQEFNELIEQLVVPETWFFRDRKPFDFLVNFVRSEWLLKPSATRLRVLSVPCSTGEEPYSIAIALLEAGLAANRFSIDALDISSLAIAKAQRASYGKNSFRGKDWVERSRYFQPLTKQRATDRYELCPLVRQVVNFRQGNLLHLNTTTSPRYDIIFCRNLLIYLDDAACQQILNMLHSLLSAQGLLFVGASETGKVPSDRFSYLREAFTFAYRKLEPALFKKPEGTSQMKVKPLVAQALSQMAQVATENNVTVSTRRNVNLAPAIPHAIATTALSPQSESSKSEAIQSDLRLARELADAGHLAAAIDCCNAYLECHSTSAEAYTLLGTLYQAMKHYEQAERYFQKALYLQPNHYESLMHLALLKEACGDVIGAQRLQQRIQNNQPK